MNCVICKDTITEGALCDNCRGKLEVVLLMGRFIKYPTSLSIDELKRLEKWLSETEKVEMCGLINKLSRGIEHD